MITLYEETPLYSVYKALYDIIFREKGDEILMYDMVDGLLREILIKNGCSFNKSSVMRYFEIIPEKYYIIDILEASGNEDNNICDFVSAHGVDYLIVFSDNLDTIVDTRKTVNSNNQGIYIQLITLVNIFVTTYSPVKWSVIKHTSAARVYNNSPYYIASAIINRICPMIEQDTEIGNFSHEDLNSFAKVPIKHLLYGL